ncbi:hypothetical protein C8F01DRAFT_1288320 [Mycena amicta]|nr:hypothetical protein C8F01DRAFT_1288320 [Mycena amicta]
MPRQKSITEFFSLRTLPANTAPEDIFNDDEPADTAVLRRDYIRYEQRGTNGMMEWTFRLARQRNQGFAPKECAWCFVTIADAEVLYKCSLDEACLKGLFACQSCILIAHEQHPEHGFVDRYEQSTGWIMLRRISDLGYVFQEGHRTMFGECSNPAPRTKRSIKQSSQLDKLGDIRYDAPLNPSNVVGDQQVHASADGRRVYSDVVNVIDTKRRRLDLQDLVEDDSRLTDWTPMSQGNLDDVRNLAAVVSSYETEPDMDDVGGKAGAEKRKRYASSDDPMSVWVPHAPMFLEELLRREGLGDFTHHPQCARCVQSLQPQVDRIFRCTHCGDYLQCEACVRSEHKAHPLHVIKDVFFKSDIMVDLVRTQAPANEWLFSTSEAFLRCDYGPAAVHSASPATLCDSYWLMAGTPATTTDPETCATLEALELFRLLQVVGNVNVHDFVGTLERLTDPTRVDATPVWKRSGRAHERGGLEGTRTGGLAVSCWACPQPGRNLPDGWKLVARSHQYLYKLMISVDANFRLKNRIRANERQDPALGEGKGYFVETKAYKEHLKTYIPEKEFHSCVAFAALLQQDTKVTTGLRVSGVGGVVCARHGLVRRQMRQRHESIAGKGR